MRYRTLALIFLVGMIAYAGNSATKSDAFAPAKDFPRGALVYAQFSDLPGLIKRWNESELKTKYLDGANYSELSKRHLGLKLASRWKEFNDAAGFPFDLDALAGFTSGHAALAVYDIGRIDFVFIAPLSDELFAATKLIQGGKFEEEELENGTKIFRVKVDADNGRQKQELLFTNCRGRLVIATSEKLLVRSVTNIDGSSRKDRLADNPAFAVLAAQTVPHTATVWTDQTALNSDYYFKRYWLMKSVNDLKAIRSGMYDFSMDAGKYTELRKFLLNGKPTVPPISEADVRSALEHIPDQVSLYSLRKAGKKVVSDAIDLTISGGASDTSPKENHRFLYKPAEYDRYSESAVSSYLDDSFDERVDETDPNDVVKSSKVKPIDVDATLASAAPRTVLTLVQPEYRPAPLFADFKRAAVINLAKSGQFSREAFESAVGKTISSQLMAAASGTTLKWETIGEKPYTRQFNLPMLGRGVCYALQGNELFVANDCQFLSSVANSKKSPYPAISTGELSDLTALDLGASRTQYREIFGKLSSRDHPDDFFSGNSDDFFTGNVESLLNLYPESTKIRITRGYSNNILREALEISTY